MLKTEDALFWNVKDALLSCQSSGNVEDVLLWNVKDALLSCQSISLLAWAGGGDTPATGPVLPTHQPGTAPSVRCFSQALRLDACGTAPPAGSRQVHEAVRVVH